MGNGRSGGIEREGGKDPRRIKMSKKKEGISMFFYKTKFTAKDAKRVRHGELERKSRDRERKTK